VASGGGDRRADQGANPPFLSRSLPPIPARKHRPGVSMGVGFRGGMEGGKEREGGRERERKGGDPAQIRQLRPDSGLGLQVKILKIV